MEMFTVLTVADGKIVKHVDYWTATSFVDFIPFGYWLKIAAWIFSAIILTCILK
jgi:hypothetical protein